MSSVKKRRLCIIALVVAVCVSLGAVLMIRASAPVEPKTVYLMPKPNPERANLLKRGLNPLNSTLFIQVGWQTVSTKR